MGIGHRAESIPHFFENRYNYEAAAREFDRWIHGEDNGTRRALPGLIDRRNEEEALFRRDGFPDIDPEIPFSPPQDLTPRPKRELPYKATPVPLRFTRTLEKGDIGEDCYILNCAMAGLQFLRLGSQPNEFTDTTDSAVRLLQKREALSRIDGKVGPETKRAIENALTRARGQGPATPFTTGTVYCRLTRTGEPA